MERVSCVKTESTCSSGLPDALAQSMRQFGQALTKIGNLQANPTNEPKENKQ